MGKSYLYAHSKWGEVFPMEQTTTTRTLEVLGLLFASYSHLEQIVSDNGLPLVSEELYQFTSKNGICHTRCAPYHFTSNGLVEQFVCTYKEVMKTGAKDGLIWNQWIANFLLTYWTTPYNSANTMFTFPSSNCLHSSQSLKSICN